MRIKSNMTYMSMKITIKPTITIRVMNIGFPPIARNARTMNGMTITINAINAIKEIFFISLYSIF